MRQLIFREILLVTLIITLNLQSSSLWRTLIVVPISLILVYSFRRIDMISGLLIVIYVIVFIGGLLIFLIRVASISPQEQRFRLRILLGLIFLYLMTPVLLFGKKLAFTFRWIMLSIWFWGEGILVLFIILILLFTLFLVTKFFMSYKGFIRSLYYYSIQFVLPLYNVSFLTKVRSTDSSNYCLYNLNPISRRT